MAAQKGASGVRDPVNFVHKNAILEETIKKELLNSKLYTEFMTNPFNPMYNITGKPNSLQDAILDGGEEDELMKKVINQARRPPTEKYTHPQTSAQDYGWITQPLLKLDREDVRLYFPRTKTDVTKPTEALWRLKEQTENMN